MSAVFLGSWTVLQALQISESVAFVWAAVLAQAAQACRNLPGTIRRQHLTLGRKYPPAAWALAVPICVLSVQVWLSDPVVSQRLVSIFCALYIAIMAMGVRGDREIINHVTPVSKESGVSLGFRRHLLMLYALVAILVIATNETLIALDTTLGTRVVVLSILPIAMHGFFWIALQLTHPPLGKNDA